MPVQDKQLAKLVRDARIAAGLTQPEAVVKTERSVGITTWSLCERGIPPGLPKKLAAIAVAVRVDTRELRKLGRYDDAADIADLMRERQTSKDAKRAALRQAQEILLTAGWKLSSKPENDGYILTLDR